MKKTTWPGNWKVVCDVCGFQYPSSEVRERWDGLIVCEKDWETRHPQDVYGYKSHHSVPPFVRPEPPDQEILVCYIDESSGYVGLATVGCSRVGDDSIPYSVLLDLSGNGH